MGCFFSCFRARDKTQLPTSNADASSSCSRKPKDVVVSRNRLSTLFLSEEREDSKRADGKNFSEGSHWDDRGLKDQAEFLKACATLSRTPAEIRRVSDKLKVSPCKDSDPSGKVQLERQPFNPPTPIKHCEEWGKQTSSLENTPSSCITNAQNSYSTEGSRTVSLHTSDMIENNTASAAPWPSVTYTRTNKSVRFECDTDLSCCDSSDYDGWKMKKTESTNNSGTYKLSPYPTPLKISHEMQTPGTVYPPAFDPEKDSRKLGESVEQLQNTTSRPEKGLNEISYKNECKVEESLSSWFKPASVILEERNRRMEIAYSQFRKTPADRPIIGMVAAHWNEDEDSHVPPPKWWDGNGIPNSTNKYKEDQKVSWHATPFEERLEKALSEDSFISQRKDLCGKPVVFYENEEGDTALSKLQSSTHPPSVVSF